MVTFRWFSGFSRLSPMVPDSAGVFLLFPDHCPAISGRALFPPCPMGAFLKLLCAELEFISFVFRFRGGGGRRLPNHGFANHTFANLFGLVFCQNFERPRNGFPGHGFRSRPLYSASFFAENPFPPTPGPGEAQKITKIARENIDTFHIAQMSLVTQSS